MNPGELSRGQTTPSAAEQLTVAITVYDRRDYLFEAIRSVLNQTVPLRPWVVEDNGPDPELQRAVEAEFGTAIRYHRNPVRRGLFDNWNACLDLCRTPYLSILHDDDWLTPWCVESWMQLLERAPDQALYFGRFFPVEDVTKLPQRAPETETEFGPVDLRQLAVCNLFGFPGQLFSTREARRHGGFRAASQYCGDWEMWVKLSAHGGAIQTSAVLGCLRHHVGWGRGTTRVNRTGRTYALTYVQIKRNLALLHRRGMIPSTELSCDRSAPLPILFLLEDGASFSRRMLRYNTSLLLHSRPLSLPYRLFQLMARVGGWRFIAVASRLFSILPTRATSYLQRKSTRFSLPA